MSSSKNSNYGDAQRYLQYKHREDQAHNCYKPVLDEFGLLQERDNCGLCSLDPYGRDCNPDDWVGNCMDTNLAYGKNRGRNDRKQMIFVISHPEADTPLLTKEALLEEGKAFVRDNLQGYDALIAAHMDTDNYHLHIVLNSVRAAERAEQPWMMHNEDGTVMRCEVAAGGKHQNSPQFRRHCQEWLLEYTRSHGYTLEDNNRVEDQRKQERYADKHEKLRQTILEAASRSKSMEELRQKLKEEQGITLSCRGSTYSVRLPDAQRARRLDTIDLTAEKLYRAMNISYTEMQALQEAQRIQIERRKYIEWLRQRRQKNCRRAEDTIADAAVLIAGAVPCYSRENFRELHDLVKQTTYLERDLQTELDKLGRLLDRWLLYQDPAVPEDQRAAHGSYVRWCGCDPDSQEDLLSLRTERDVVSLQIKEAAALREALLASADQWKDRNAQERFRYHEEWTLSREAQLKQRRKSVKASSRKLAKIASNCQLAADRRIYKKPYLEKAVYFRELWHEKYLEEKELKKELREAKKAARAVRRQRREMER